MQADCCPVLLEWMSPVVFQRRDLLWLHTSRRLPEDDQTLEGCRTDS